MWEYEMAATIKRTTVSSLELPRIRSFVTEYERLVKEPDYYAQSTMTAMDRNALLAKVIGYLDSIATDLESVPSK